MSIIPLADNFNHKNCDVLWQFVNKQSHLERDVNSQYFTKNRFMNDYSGLFNDCEKTKKYLRSLPQNDMEQTILGIIGYNDPDAQTANDKLYGPESWK
jgi:hypothetical protein